jgi:hypothetical protein
MLNGYEISLIVSAFLALGCGGDAVDLGHDSHGWADVPAQTASVASPPIYQSENPVFGFTLDDTTLYALIDRVDAGGSSFELVACPFDRCRSERRVLFNGPKLGREGPDSTPLILVGGVLYWVFANGEPSGIAACPATGCDRPRVLSSQYRSCLAGDIDGVYWLDADKSLLRMRPDAEAPEYVRSLADEAIEPVGMLASGDYIYLAGYGNDIESVRRVRKDGTGDSELVLTDEHIGGFSMGSDAIYYTSRILTGRVAKCPLDGCGAGGSTLAASQRWPEGIQVSGSDVFWVNNSRPTANGTHASISSCELPDCALVQKRVSDFPHFTSNSPDEARFVVNRQVIVWLEPYRSGTGLRSVLR